MPAHDLLEMEQNYNKNIGIQLEMKSDRRCECFYYDVKETYEMNDDDET